MFFLNGDKRKHILTAILLGVVSTICSGGELSESDLLRLIADGYEDNLSRLRTWTGSAVREASDKGGAVKWTESLVFISDRDQEASLWRGHRICTSEESGEQITKLNSGMNKGAYAYRMDFLSEPSGNYSKSRQGTLLIYNSESAPTGLYTPSFDPIHLLTSTLGVDGQLANGLRIWAEAIEKNLGPEGCYQFSREDSKVKIILYSSDETGNVNKNFFSTYVFDLKKGYSLVESHDVGADTESRWVVDYEEHNGIFVPNKITTKLISEKLNINNTRNVTIATKSINEKIPPSEFQYQKLGLYPGGYIVDHSVGGLRYQWKISDEIKDEVDAVLDSMISNDGELVASKNKDKQAPEIDDAEVTKLPVDNIKNDANTKLHAENKIDLRQSFIVIIAILAAIALCYTIIRVLRGKREK